MSESIEVTIKARGEEFEVDVAGLKGPDELHELVNDVWSDMWIMEDAPARTNTSELIEEDWEVDLTSVEGHFAWLFDKNMDNWEWDWIEFLMDCDDYLTTSIANAAWECNIAPGDVEEAYNGEWGSDAEFVQDLCESTGYLPDDFPSYIYIDWEKTASDIMMDYCEHAGYYFRNL